MADIQPLHTLRYDTAVSGPLETVIAPPYDVIDHADRAALLQRSAYNVVEIDLPRAANGGDPYRHAAETLAGWRTEGVLTREEEPALWALEQRYTAPTGERLRRSGILARVRIEGYGAGRIRPHERTHPGPKQDRLRLTRATKANLSPIFSLYPDREGSAASVLDVTLAEAPFDSATDSDGIEHRLWRIADTNRIASLQGALADIELLIADGHHRYETARIYADEIGGEGGHRYVLMLLCSLADPGLTVFPTHRLLTDLADDTAKQQAIREAVTRDFDIEQVDREALEPDGSSGRVELGYMDSFHKQPYRLTLKDQSIADAALEGMPAPYRRLDTAVLEAILLKGALRMSEEDISHLRGLRYSKSFGDAREAVESGSADAGFFMRATPVEQVRQVAETGELMPPKSTYFFPKVPTGLVFSELT